MDKIYENQRVSKSICHTARQAVRRRFIIYAGSCVALALCLGVGHRKFVTRFGVIRRG